MTIVATRIFLICTILLSSIGFAEAMTLDQAVEKFLSGGKITKEDIEGIKGFGFTDFRGAKNEGEIYLYQMKRVIVSPPATKPRARRTNKLMHNPPAEELESLLPIHWIQARGAEAKPIEVETTAVA